MNEFEKIVNEHRSRYPLMKPQDLCKLAYQNEFGPEHLIENENDVLLYLAAEWKEAPETDIPPEDIGGGLCRFHLNGADYTEEAAVLLAKLFRMTADSVKGTPDGLRQKLKYLEKLDVDGIAEYIEKYREAGCPLTSHSENFRKKYEPHYRLLRKEYAGYFPALLKISELSERSDPVIIAIDGHCGSGKTRFAELITQLFSCNVFHTDDFYLPLSERAKNWREISGGNMDFGRLLSEVVLPAKNGMDVYYRPYRCHSGSYEETTVITSKQLSIIEGSYSHDPVLSERYDLKILLTCSKESQARRLKEREGEYYEAFEETWIPMEKKHLKENNVCAIADMTIDTTELF